MCVCECAFLCICNIICIVFVQLAPSFPFTFIFTALKHLTAKIEFNPQNAYLTRQNVNLNNSNISNIWYYTRNNLCSRSLIIFFYASHLSAFEFFFDSSPFAWLVQVRATQFNENGSGCVCIYIYNQS